MLHRNSTICKIGWREELYSIYGPPLPFLQDASTGLYPSPLPGTNLAFRLERAACSLFSLRTFGVHCTGYISNPTTQETSLWVAKRSHSKPTWPGRLDNTVAGGISSGSTPYESMVRECTEEASLDSRWVRSRLRPVGTISYLTKSEVGGWYQPETQYLYDLPFDSSPLTSDSVRPITNAQDGEVENFTLLPESEILSSLLSEEWKPNCVLVVIDFLIRKGKVTFESDAKFTEICESLRRGVGLPGPA